MLIDYVGMDVLNDGIRGQGFESMRILNYLDFTRWHTFGNTIPEDYDRLLGGIAQGTFASKEVSQLMLAVLLKRQNSPML